MSVHGAVANRIQCPQCLDTSRDNLVVYEDGYAKCFACDHFEYNKTPGPIVKREIKVIPMLPQDSLRYAGLRSRCIRKETCEHFKYAIGSYRETMVEVSQYHQAQKIKFPARDGNKKAYLWLGEKSTEFFGQALYTKGKRIVITEGEIDAMSVAQVLGLQWPCVSVTSGAKGAAQQVRDNLQYLSKFEEVVLFFDADEPGQSAAAEVSELLPGRVRVAQYPGGYKDANELLMAGREEDIKKAFWNAAEPMPEDILELSDLGYDDVMTKPVIGYDLPFSKLSSSIRGLRKGELTLITSGSGMGKSTACREITFKLAVEDKLKVANIYLEEGHIKTAQGFIALDNNVPLGDLIMNPELITREQFEESKRKIFNATGMLTIKHFGSINCDKLIKKLEYLAVGKQVDFIILDHISIVVSGQESDNERKDIDILMTKLREFIERTGVGVVAVVHLKRPPQGKAFNEGREISLSDLRGSAALEQLTDTVIALEGNQQDERMKHIRVFRVLKCRLFGDAVGFAGASKYVKETGRLLNENSITQNPFQEVSKNGNRSKHDAANRSYSSFGTAGSDDF